MKINFITGTAIVGRTVSVDSTESTYIRSFIEHIDHELEDHKQISSAHWKEMYFEFFKPFLAKFYTEVDYLKVYDAMFKNEDENEKSQTTPSVTVHLDESIFE